MAKVELLSVSCVQFKRSPPKVPYKAIALATFLFVVGALLIIIGSLLLAKYIKVEVGVNTLASYTFLSNDYMRTRHWSRKWKSLLSDKFQ